MRITEQDGVVLHVCQNQDNGKIWTSKGSCQFTLHGPFVDGVWMRADFPLDDHPPNEHLPVCPYCGEHLPKVMW